MCLEGSQAWTPSNQAKSLLKCQVLCQVQRSEDPLLQPLKEPCLVQARKLQAQQQQARKQQGLLLEPLEAVGPELAVLPCRPEAVPPGELEARPDVPVRAGQPCEVLEQHQQVAPAPKTWKVLKAQAQSWLEEGGDDEVT